MLYVSIFVELLRSRPALAVWLAALVQALLWTLVPSLFYAGPPGDVPNVLAVGHEFQLGTYLGPPLAFWLAELAFVLAGMFGVYVLSQVCVVVTYWAVFALGRSIVGAQHAALAVLLMVGVAAFTVPTPDFGPVILTMPLWAIILLHYWRAVGEGRRAYWLLLAIEIGLLLLTTYVGLILVGLLVLFTLVNARARAALNSYDPLIAAVVAGIVMGPHLIWVADSGEGLRPILLRLRTPEAVVGNLVAWLQQIGLIFAAHAGLIVLVALVAGWPWPRHDPAPVIVRREVDPLARQFVYFFAVAPAFAGTLVAVLLGWAGPVGGIAPLVILSGLAGGRGGRRRHRVQPPARRDRGLVRASGHSADHGGRRGRGAPLAQYRPAGDLSGRSHGAVLLGKLRASHRGATAHRHRRSRHRRAGRARRREPPERLSERHARALAVGHGRYDQDQGCDRGLADHRYRRHPAARDQGALSGSCFRGPARVRALGAGSAAAHARRLGFDQAAKPGPTANPE